MKLLNCYIENFGKLHNFKYEFNEGLNIIKEKNGFGKTTFATFIKSMFYGLDAGTNLKIEKSERKKYYPWQGGLYGGNIEFQIEDKKYRIERFFEKKQNEDSFKLYNLSTNLESNDYGENIGEEIFKINKSAYERSTYIPQGQIKIEMEDSLSAKLGNVLESDNDINNSDVALKRLNDAKKFYIKDKGKGGIIDEKKQKLDLLVRRLENSRSDIDNLEIKKKRLKDINDQIKEQNNLYDETQKKLSVKIESDRKAAKLESYETITKKNEQIEETLNYLKQFFKDDIPTESLIKSLNNKNSELERIKSDIDNSKLSNIDIENLDKLKEKFDGNNISEDEIDQAIKDCYRIPEIENEIQVAKKDIEQNKIMLKRKKKIYVILLIISFAFLILSLIILIKKINNIVGFSGVILNSLLLAFCIFMVYKKSRKTSISTNKQLQNLELNKNNIETQIYNLLKLTKSNNSDKAIALSNIKTEYNNYNELLNKQAENDIKLQKNIMKKTAIESELRTLLKKYFQNIDTSYIDLIQELNTKKNEYETLIKQYEESKAEKEKFEKENNIESLKENNNASEISEEELKHEIMEINNKINILLDEKNQIKNQIEILENQIDENEYTESDIENLKEEIKNLNDKYNILSKTEQLLKTAKENFSSSYLQDMIDGFNKYLNIINEEDLKTNVDIKLDVKIDVNGSQKEVKYFSSGYRDLIYICMRFSLIKALFKDELPFVVLDDPFVNLDEDRTNQALKVIDEIAKEYQIIYFVCNSSRA